MAALIIIAFRACPKGYVQHLFLGCFLPQTLTHAVPQNLDIQYTVGVATGVPVVYVFVGEQNQDGEYDGWLDEVNYLLAQENPPQVMTSSWGAYEESQYSQPVTECVY